MRKPGDRKRIDVVERSQPIIKGCQPKVDWKVGTEAETMEEHCFWSLDSLSAIFPVALSKDGAAHSGLHPSTSISNQETLPKVMTTSN